VSGRDALKVWHTEGARARVVLGYYGAGLWPACPLVMTELPCGQFSGGERKSLVRHYPYFHLRFTIADLREFLAMHVGVDSSDGLSGISSLSSINKKQRYRKNDKPKCKRNEKMVKKESMINLVAVGNNPRATLWHSNKM